MINISEENIFGLTLYKNVNIPKIDKSNGELTKLGESILQVFSENDKAAMLNHRITYGIISQVYKLNIDGKDYAIKLKKNRSVKKRALYLMKIFLNNLAGPIYLDYRNASYKLRFEQEKHIRQLWAEEGFETPQVYETGLKNVQVMDWIDAYNLLQLQKRPELSGKTDNNLSIEEIVNKEELSFDKKMTILEYVTYDLSQRQEYAIEKDNPLLIPTDTNPTNVLLKKKDAKIVWIDSDCFINHKRSSTKEVTAMNLMAFMISQVLHNRLTDEEVSRKYIRSICNAYENKDILRIIVAKYEKSTLLRNAKERVKKTINYNQIPQFKLIKKIPDIIKDYI